MKEMRFQMNETRGYNTISDKRFLTFLFSFFFFFDGKITNIAVPEIKEAMKRIQ